MESISVMENILIDIKPKSIGASVKVDNEGIGVKI